jgi:hypothetical protein
MMMWRWLFPIILLAALPAQADDLVTTTQVVAAAAVGALPASVLGNLPTSANASGNVSVIVQSGYGNVAQTAQTGTGDFAAINQAGNNFIASILQTNQHDSAVVNQTGNGIGAQPITITQTGPAQSITITQHR